MEANSTWSEDLSSNFCTFCVKRYPSPTIPVNFTSLSPFRIFAWKVTSFPFESFPSRMRPISFSSPRINEAILVLSSLRIERAQLIKQLKKHGGEVYKYKEVVQFDSIENDITAVKMKDGSSISANIFISNIDPKTTLKMVGEDKFRKSFFNRIESLEGVISAFSLYVVFKPETFKYINHNYYHYKNSNEVWTAHEYDEQSWPKAYMCSMNAGKSDVWADGMTFLTYMKFDELKEWEQTFNTTAIKEDRGESYEEFKARKAEKFLKEIEIKFPGIRKCIKSIHTSTPLSYRDYIGGYKGNMYGYEKDANNPMKTFIASKTKLNNLYLTGQSINMHGVLGVTIGAVLTCSEIVGKEYLVNKINQSSL